MFWDKNYEKVYPSKPKFYYIKVGRKGVFVTRTCLRDAFSCVFSVQVTLILFNKPVIHARIVIDFIDGVNDITYM